MVLGLNTPCYLTAQPADTNTIAYSAAVNGFVPTSVLSLTNVNLTNVAQQITLGVAPKLTTITCPAPAAGQLLNIYDVSAQGVVNIQLGVDGIMPITAAASITGTSSGCLITLTSAASNYILSLPAAASSAGVKFKIVLSVTARTNTVTIQTNASENKLQGIVFGAATQVPCVNKHNLVFGTTAVVGDYVELESDGINWAVRAWAQTAGAFTVA
jgi:hypothetical protein